MKADDRRIAPHSGWLDFLDGRAPEYPERALRGEFGRLRAKVKAMRRDTTTADTRLADDPLSYNPATVDELIRLALGGISPLQATGEPCSVAAFATAIPKHAGLACRRTWRPWSRASTPRPPPSGSLT